MPFFLKDPVSEPHSHSLGFPPGWLPLGDTPLPYIIKSNCKTPDRHQTEAKKHLLTQTLSA